MSPDNTQSVHPRLSRGTIAMGAFAVVSAIVCVVALFVGVSHDKQGLIGAAFAFMACLYSSIATVKWARKDLRHEPHTAHHRPHIVTHHGVTPVEVSKAITLIRGKLLTTTADTVGELAKQQGRFLATPQYSVHSNAAWLARSAALTDNVPPDGSAVYVYRDGFGLYHVFVFGNPLTAWSTRQSEHLKAAYHPDLPAIKRDSAHA